MPEYRVRREGDERHILAEGVPDCLHGQRLALVPHEPHAAQVALPVHTSVRELSNVDLLPLVIKRRLNIGLVWNRYSSEISYKSIHINSLKPDYNQKYI